MTTITVRDREDLAYRPLQWRETISAAHYIWEKDGIDFRDFEGQRASDCAVPVSRLIKNILNDPRQYIGAAGYLNLQAVLAHLTGLCLLLSHERPDGIVHVS